MCCWWRRLRPQAACNLVRALGLHLLACTRACSAWLTLGGGCLVAAWHALPLPADPQSGLLVAPMFACRVQLGESAGQLRAQCLDRTVALTLGEPWRLLRGCGAAVTNALQPLSLCWECLTSSARSPVQGVTGGVEAMPSFLQHFFPDVRAKGQGCKLWCEHGTPSQRCPYSANNPRCVACRAGVCQQAGRGGQP